MESNGKVKKVKIVLSDLHLGSGIFRSNGDKNARENFFFDRELIELINYFSSNKYENAPVELILNGDILDFFTVHYKNKYLFFISEKVSLYKLKKIIKGHKKVFKALADFLNKPNKKITYIIGNHDVDFFFKEVQNYFIQEIGKEINQEKIKFIEDPFYEVEGKIQIHHGHQFEAMHNFNYENPFLIDKKGRKVLNLPWGSLYVMNAVNRFKLQRDYLDKVAPIYLLILYALITDFFFICKFILFTTYYYLRSRFVYLPLRKTTTTISRFFSLLKDEFHLLDDGEQAGRAVLKSNPDIYAIIMGHTHRPKQVTYPNHQIYVNTGTWIKSVFFDLQYFGKFNRLPFCLIEYEDEEIYPRISLFEWKGVQSHFRYFLQ